MSTFQQICPSCQRSLELPLAANGRTAKCPACETTFTAVDSQGSPPPQLSEPYSAPSPGYSAPNNPYQPSVQTDPVQSGGFTIVPRSFEEAISATTAIFGERWGMLVIGVVIFFAINIAVSVVTQIFIGVAATAGEGPGGIAALVSLPFSIFAQTYLQAGLIRNALGVVRNIPTPINEFIVPLGIVVRLLCGGLLVGLVVGVVAFIFVAIIAVLGSSGNDGLAGILAIVGILIGATMTVALSWLLWSWQFVICDGQTGLIQSFQTSVAITMANKVSSLLVLLVAGVATIAGALLCGIGLLISIPFANALIATAYLLMTNQRISDPRVGPSYPQ